MSSPLIEKLTSIHGYPVLTADSFDLFVYQHKQVILFFTQNAASFPESNDVAIILPELIKFFPQLNAAVIDTSIERELQTRYRFTRYPSLVFLKEGGYQGVISGVLDWRDFLEQTQQIINAEVTQPPVFDLDKTCVVH